MVGKVRPPTQKVALWVFNPLQKVQIHQFHKMPRKRRCKWFGITNSKDSFSFLPSSSDHHPVVTSQEMPSNHNFITAEYTGTQKCDICRKKVNRELGDPGAIVLCICWCCVCVCWHDLDMDSEVIPCLRVSELWSQMSQKVCRLLHERSLLPKVLSMIFFEVGSIPPIPLFQEGNWPPCSGCGCGSAAVTWWWGRGRRGSDTSQKLTPTLGTGRGRGRRRWSSQWVACSHYVEEEPLSL